MSEAVDTRVVEARFDSEQFEKGVDRTVKKLDELKKSLTFAETGKSIADLSSKTQDATEKSASALEKLEARITSFTGMLKQKLLSGIADEVVGVLFKMKNAFTSFVSSLSGAQVRNGLQRYTDIMTSVRTLTAAGVDQNMAYASIERLGAYADQTSYSLDQLVSTMSKFRTAGADLATAERMVIGLSNAAASMGVSTQDAARAYLNMQQAYSKGFMSHNDWLSFESLPMVGEKFNQAILDAAVHVGTLKREANGTYSTLSKVDKQVKTSGADAKGITAQNLGTKLASRWFNKAVMEEVFGSTYYFSIADSEIIHQLSRKEAELREKIGTLVNGEEYTEETFNADFQAILDAQALEFRAEKVAELDQLLADGTINATEYNRALADFESSNHLTVFGWKAFRAGQEARSFADVLNTLKDVISRGWAKSFELIFGKLDEAAEFFTSLTENQLADAIYSIGEFRNAVLETWNTTGGRNELILALETIDNTIGDILGGFSLFDTEGEGFELVTQKIGHSLKQATFQFRVFLENLRDWLNSTDGKDGMSRIQRIQKFISDLGRIVGNIASAIGIAFNYIGKAAVLLIPVFDSLSRALGRITESASDDTNPNKNGSLFNNIIRLLDGILKAAEPFIPIAATLIDVLGEVASFFIDLSVGTFSTNVEFFADVIGLIVTLLGGNASDIEEGGDALSKVGAEIKKFGDFCKRAFTSVSNFFTALLNDLRWLLGLNVGENSEDGGFFKHLSDYFNADSFVKEIQTAIESIPSRIEDLWNAVLDFFLGRRVKTTVVTGPGQTKEITTRVKEGFSLWLDKTVKSVYNWITIELPKKVKKIWNDILDFFLGKKVTIPKTINPKTGKVETMTVRIKEGFSLWLDNAIKDVKKWVTEDFPKKISEIWKTIVDFFLGKEQTTVVVTGNGETKEITTRVKEGFSLWLDNTIRDIKDWIFVDLPAKIGEIWNNIIDFIFGKEVPVKSYSKVGDDTVGTTRIKQGFSAWLNNVKNKIVTWITELSTRAKEIWENIIDFIFGKEVPVKSYDKFGDDNVGTTRIRQGFSAWLNNVTKNIVAWITELPNKAKEIWGQVLDFIVGRKAEPGEVKNPETGETYAPNERVKEGFSLWLDNLITEIGKWIASVPDKIRNIWNVVLDAIFGIDRRYYRFDKSVGDFDQVLNKIVGGVKDDIKDAVGETKDSLNSAVDAENEPSNFTILDSVTETVQWLGKKIGEIISNLPTYIVNGISFSVDFLTDLFGRIKDWFDKRNAADILEEISEVDAAKEILKDSENKEEMSPFLQSLISFGKNFASLITVVIPGTLSSAFTFVKNNAGGWWESAKSIFDDFIHNPDGLGKVTSKIEEIGHTIAEAIENLPDMISKAFQEVKKLFSGNNQKDLGLSFTDEDGSIISKGRLKTSKRVIGKQVKQFAEDVNDEVNSGLESLLPSDLREKWSVWDTIKEIGIAIGDAFIEIGPHVVNGVTEAVDWIAKGLTKLTTWLQDKPNDVKLTDYISQKLEGSEEDSKFKPLWDAAVSLGQSLKNIFTQVIPNFLSEAFNEIAGQIPQLLNGAFSNPENQVDIAGEVTRSLGMSSGKEAVDEISLPFNEDVEGAVKALDEVKNIEKKISDTIQDGSIFNSNYHRVFGLIKEKNIDTEPIVQYTRNRKLALLVFQRKLEEAKESGSEDVEYYERLVEELNSIGTDYVRLKSDQSGFEPTYIPWTHENIRVVRSRIELLHELRDELAGIDSNSSEAKKISDKITLLESIENEFVEIFNNDSFEAISTEEVLGVSETAKENAQKSSESITDIFGSFQSILKTVTESDTVKIVAICLALMYVMSKVRDLLTLADELEAPGYTAKWQAIEIAIMGIVGILGWITYLASDTSDAGKERLESVKGTLREIGEFIKELAAIIKTISEILLMKEIAETVGDFAEGSSTKGFLSKIFGIVGVIAGAPVASESISTALETLTDTIGDIIVDIGTVFDSFLEGIRPAIDKLADAVDPLKKATEAMDLLADLLGKFFDAFDVALVYSFNPDDISNGKLIKTSGPGLNVRTEGWTRFNEEFIADLETRIGAVYQLATIISKLGEAAKVFEEIDDTSALMDKILSIVGKTGEENSFTEFIKRVMEVVASTFNSDDVSSLFVSGYGFSLFDIDAISMALDMIGSALSIFGNGIVGLTQENVQAFNDIINILNSLGNAPIDNLGRPGLLTKLASGDVSIVAFGRNLSNFSVNMSTFFNHISNLKGTDDPETYDRILRSIHAVSLVAQGVGEAVRIMSTGDFPGDIIDKLPTFGESISIFGDHVKTFFKSINEMVSPDLTIERVEVLAKVVSAISDLMVGVGAMAGIELYKNTNHITQYLDQFMEALAESTNFNNGLFGLGSDVANTFYYGFVSGIEESELETLGKVLEANKEALHKIRDEMLLDLKSPEFYANSQAAGRQIDSGLANGLRTGEAMKEIQALSNILEESGILNAITALKEDNGDATRPEITPVLVISDDFVNKANELRSMLGIGAITVDENGEWNIPDTSIDLANGIDVPVPVDYSSKLDAIKTSLDNTYNSVNNFNTSLRSTKFVISGKDFTYTIGPDIDEYLGRESVYLVRRSGV